jgi:hypothetical protein
MAAAVLAIASCGQSTKTQTAQTQSANAQPTQTQSAKALTRSELITKADAICYHANSKRDSVKTRNEFVSYVTGMASIEKAAGAELGGLVPPASMSSDWGRIVTGTEELANILTRLAEYARSHKGEPPQGSLYASATVTQERVLSTAKRDGFRDCSRTYVHSADR